MAKLFKTSSYSNLLFKMIALVAARIESLISDQYVKYLKFIIIIFRNSIK